ncbi:alanine/glycine:cation symporter family protein [Caproicibacterium lactatifermentans]|uniref:Amino acid carrier protein n=1 Tax=Caproicibacterium lactatifermentans TaxID=2666138 RepID=A0A859DPK8_9FIRM|nr:sodium:alanine symporter family protein [Caproicibacterium lactatifermentans]QKN23385.1 amino acid carrier protein [Caproicibacterium lactatifermentans]
MSKITNLLERIDGAVWGPVMVTALIGTGIFLMFRLHFLPWRNLGYALRSVFGEDSHKKNGSGDITPFAALMTTLAATIGTGNIAGVATAMVMGGPGALVWMWISAMVGLATKYTECTLAVRFRERDQNGEMCGGPMYTIKNGFRCKKLGMVLAALFAVFTVLASFGIGDLTQANSISSAIYGTFHIPTWITGLVITILAFVVLVGGIQSISKVSSILVPAMAVLYMMAGFACIFSRIQNVPAGLAQIFHMAFTARAAAGGVGGTIVVTMMNAMRAGCSRGVFSNEAGLGSAAITSAAATTDYPARQGYISMTGAFFDTIVVCTVTGLSIAASGVLGTKGPDGHVLNGVELTMQAFQSVLGPMGAWIVAISLTLFAFSTIIGWEYMGEVALKFLVKNPSASYVYRVLFAFMSLIGSTVEMQLVWTLSDITNALMAIPNLISLLALSGVAVKETVIYQKKVVVPEREARRVRRKQKCVQNT